MKYVYPAIFTTENAGGYSVTFPDIPGCYTQGEDRTEAISMAEEVLSLMMSQRELEGLPAPVPTELYTLVIAEGEEAILITAETLGYKVC